jgi:Na+-driven multidrug efflux pump
VSKTIQALAHENAGAAIRRLAIPTSFAILGDQVLGIADTIAIGTLGTAALAGIAGASSVFLVFGIGLYAFGSGLRIIGAQAIGAGRSDRFGTIVRSSAIAPVALACGIILAGSVAAFPLMQALLPAGAPVDASARYLMLRFCCLVPAAITSQLIVAFATAGETRMGLRVLLVINAIHIPLLCVLALGAGTHHALGLVGAGISSLVAECTGLAFALIQSARRPHFRILASWRVDPELVRATASLSWPDFVFLTLQIVPDPIALALLAPSGAPLVAAYRALAIVNDATWSIPGSLGDAVETIVGQRIGANDYTGAKAFWRSSLRINMRICIAAALIVAALAWPLAAACTLNPRLATAAAIPLALHVLLTLPLKGYAMTALAPIRAAGDTRWVMYMGILTTAIAVGGIAAGVLALHLGLYAFPFGWTAAWVFRDVTTMLRLRSGDWERRRLAVASG